MWKGMQGSIKNASMCTVVHVVSSRIVLATQLTALHAAHTDCTGMFVQYFMHTSNNLIA